ncbi:uncharacterized protein [Nicotiana tomentosiformis]|uniref:uncharacterized protein n=1 Tax=Nicotiana tomentosiformis TaxID=4098 RepID=UPI00388C6309
MERKRPNISYFHPFGCICFIHNNGKDNLGKFDPKSDEGENTLDEVTNQQDQSTNSPTKNQGSSTTDPINYIENEPILVVPNEWKSEHGYSHKYMIGDPQEGIKTRRSLKQTSNVALISQFEPKKVDEALGDKSWKTSMMEELDQFEKNKVWELIPKPPNASIVGTKWVYRNKLNESGQVVGNKARLVAQGYSQQERIDYEETFAPVARYLIGTVDYGLWYESLDNFDLKGFSDVDFAGDKIDRKSTSGMCQLLEKSLMSWNSKKQSCVALSTTEAEYFAVGNCCTQVLWIMHQLLDNDLRINCVPIMCDNTSAICLSKKCVHHSRAKHIEIKHNFIRDHVAKGDIVLEFINTENQLVDIFTKLCLKKDFVSFVTK